MSVGCITQVSVSRGGVPKRAVLFGLLDATGVTGDKQKEREFHGGPDRAVCLWSAERIVALAAEGHPIYPGASGENVTVSGLDWALVVPGVRLRLGADVCLEVTGFAPPCKKNARFFLAGDFNRMHPRRHPGWSRVYARVVTGGVIKRGDRALLVAAEASPQDPSW